MNKKAIDTTLIENELEGASLFFSTTEQSKSHPKAVSAIKEDGNAQQTQGSQAATDRTEQKPQQPLSHEPLVLEQPPKAAAQTDKQSAPPDTVIPSHHDTTVSRHHDTTTPSMIESIRRAVKLVGKEAATHRFTPEEKQAIADIIYTYRRQGYDTSENEIARIAINWLVWDHQEKNEDSILAHVLKALKE